MRENRSTTLLKAVAVFLIGMIMGGSGVNIFLGGQVDRIYLVNRSLQEQLASKEKELQQIKENLAEYKFQMITSLQTRVTIDQVKGMAEYEQIKVRLIVENKVKEWLQPVIGQDIANLEHLLIPRVVDNREIEVDGRKYLLKVTLVVVSQKTMVYVTVMPQNKQI